jgi:hypothetical protein
LFKILGLDPNLMLAVRWMVLDPNSWIGFADFGQVASLPAAFFPTLI